MINDKPYFSVVLITYNRAVLLPRCIESVLNQTFGNLELIIVDNHSDDGSIELINDYKNKDSRVKLLLVHNNNILAYSRNEGIKKAKGQYICMLDSDDWYTLDKLQIVYNEIQKKGGDIIYNKYTLMSQKGQGRTLGRSLKWNDTFHELLVNGNIICNTTAVVKRSAIIEIGYLSEDPDLKAVEDIDLWLRLAKAGFKFHFINRVLGFYWVGENMSYSPKQIQQINNLYNKYIPIANKRYQEQALSNKTYTNARVFHKIGYWKDAKLAYKASFKTVPILKKMNIFVLLCFLHLKIKF